MDIRHWENCILSRKRHLITMNSRQQPQKKEGKMRIRAFPVSTWGNDRKKKLINECQQIKIFTFDIAVSWGEGSLSKVHLKIIPFSSVKFRSARCKIYFWICLRFQITKNVLWSSRARYIGWWTLSTLTFNVFDSKILRRGLLDHIFPTFSSFLIKFPLLL